MTQSRIDAFTVSRTAARTERAQRTPVNLLDVFEDKLPRKHLLEDIFIDQERRRPTALR